MEATKKAGWQAFQKFSAGGFAGKPTPKNPHPRGSAEYDAWAEGYDAALGEWFR